MGLDEADFARAFLVALSDDSVVNKLSEVVTRPMKFDLDNLFDSNTKVLAELQKFSELNICLRKEVAELRDVIKQRNHTIEQLQMKLSTAEEMLDEQEQYSRRNSLRVSGIPEEPDETLENKVIDIFNKRLKFVPPMTENDLDRIHRVGKPAARSTPWQILIKFATYGSRQRVYKERKKNWWGIQKMKQPKKMMDPKQWFISMKILQKSEQPYSGKPDISLKISKYEVAGQMMAEFSLRTNLVISNW